MALPNVRTKSMGRIEPWGDRPRRACRTLRSDRADAWGPGDRGGLGPGGIGGCIIWPFHDKSGPMAIMLATDAARVRPRAHVAHTLVAGRQVVAQVRDTVFYKTPSWPRDWANFSPLLLYFHINAWANLHLLGQLIITPFSLHGATLERVCSPACCRRPDDR